MINSRLSTNGFLSLIQSTHNCLFLPKTLSHCLRILLKSLGQPRNIRRVTIQRRMSHLVIPIVNLSGLNSILASPSETHTKSRSMYRNRRSCGSILAKHLPKLKRNIREILPSSAMTPRPISSKVSESLQLQLPYLQEGRSPLLILLGSTCMPSTLLALLDPTCSRRTSNLVGPKRVNHRSCKIEPITENMQSPIRYHRATRQGLVAMLILKRCIINEPSNRMPLNSIHHNFTTHRAT